MQGPAPAVGARTAKLPLVLGAGLGLAACGSGTGSATGTVSAFISALQSKNFSQACSYVDRPPSDCAVYVAQQLSEQSQQSAGGGLGRGRGTLDSAFHLLWMFSASLSGS